MGKTKNELISILKKIKKQRKKLKKQKEKLEINGHSTIYVCNKIKRKTAQVKLAKALLEQQ